MAPATLMPLDPPRQSPSSLNRSKMMGSASAFTPPSFVGTLRRLHERPRNPTSSGGLSSRALNRMVSLVSQPGETSTNSSKSLIESYCDHQAHGHQHHAKDHLAAFP